MLFIVSGKKESIRSGDEMKTKEILLYTPAITLGLARFAIEQIKRPWKLDNEKKVARAAITHYRTPEKEEK